MGTLNRIYEMTKTAARRQAILNHKADILLADVRNALGVHFAHSTHVDSDTAVIAIKMNDASQLTLTLIFGGSRTTNASEIVIRLEQDADFWNFADPIHAIAKLTEIGRRV